MCVVLFTLILLLGKCSAYIYRLNGSEYSRMPPIFHLDPYEACIHEGNDSGVYCSVKVDLVIDAPSELYNMIREYSKKTEIHFNYTTLSYGICLTKTCKQFYQNNTTEDPGVALEACLNRSLWENYKLKAKLQEKYCEQLEEMVDINTSHVIVAVLLVSLLMLNCVGSFREFCFGQNKNDKQGTSLLSCFSISLNWRNLVAPAEASPEPRLARLTGLYGVKTISIMCVIMFHSMLPFVMNCENVHYFEEGYSKWYYQIIANGTLVVQTFFMMSGFLLSYNMQIYAEIDKVTWLSIPHIIIVRWLRLTPPYLLVLAVTATWMRYFGSGPLWQMVVISEVEDCRRDWWLHLLYLNNYVNSSHCMIQSWYIAADFQLFCVGVLVCVLTAGRRRRILLASLFTAALLMTAAHTFVQDLDANLMITPEMARNFFILDPTFIYTYKRGHTNLASFVVGLSLGLLVYHWQANGYKFPASVKLRVLYWMTVPAALGVILLARVFYRDAPRASVYVRTIYAALVKPVWAGIFGYLIVGMVFQLEDVYRGVLEWPGWAVLSRVSYCAYILHMMFIRLLTGTRTTTNQFSILHFLETLTSSITISFLAAVPFHLLVEAPFLQLTKLTFSKNKESRKTGDVQKPIDNDGNSNEVCIDDKHLRRDDALRDEHTKDEE